MLFTKILYNHLVRDKCFDTQEKSVPHDKVKKKHNKSSETQKPETLSKRKDEG